MSLEIFINDAPQDRELVRNVRAQFMQIAKIEPTEATRHFLSEIEQGQYSTSDAFIFSSDALMEFQYDEETNTNSLTPWSEYLKKQGVLLG